MLSDFILSLAQSHVLELDRLIGDLATDLDWKTNSILRYCLQVHLEAKSVFRPPGYPAYDMGFSTLSDKVCLVAFNKLYIRLFFL